MDQQYEDDKVPDYTIHVGTKYNVVKDYNETITEVCNTFSSEVYAIPYYENMMSPAGLAPGITYSIRAVGSFGSVKYEVVKHTTVSKISVISSCDTMAAALSVQAINPGSRIVPMEQRRDTRKPSYWDNLWKAFTNF